ncbi:MAG: hypothetical protein ACT4RN_03620 [Pseudonocardia sp.]
MTVVTAPVAAAAPALQTHRLLVKCIASESPVGVWVKSSRTKPDFAKRLPFNVNVSNVIGWHQYEFRIQKGENYRLHVGCGGNRKTWGMTAKTGDIRGAGHRIACNDIHPAIDLLQPTKKLPKEIRVLLRIDLANGLSRGECGVVRR